MTVDDIRAIKEAMRAAAVPASRRREAMFRRLLLCSTMHFDAATQAMRTFRTS